MGLFLYKAPGKKSGPLLKICKVYLQNKLSMWTRSREACLVWSRQYFSVIATAGTLGQRGLHGFCIEFPGGIG